jgi:hypothetical protein
MPPSTRPFGQKVQEILLALNPGTAFLVMIFGALIAFEMFNYTTTDHALQDLLGTIQFGGMTWSTILALAFCGIDFAGIARLFTPEQGIDEPKEVWYLFGAWLLAATMNAILTWWGVSMAITNHKVQSSIVVDPKTIATVVPVFVAVMVWVIRILIIGTLSMALDRTLHNGVRRPSTVRRFPSPQPSLPQTAAPSLGASSNSGIASRPAFTRSAAPAGPSRPAEYSNRPAQQAEATRSFSEPTYHSLSMNGRTSTPVSSAGDRGGSNSNPSSSGIPSRKF